MQQWGAYILLLLDYRKVGFQVEFGHKLLFVQSVVS